MEKLAARLEALRAKAMDGGGPARRSRERAKGKLTARERLAALLDPGGEWFEVGLLVAHDRYEGEAPSAGVVTGLGRVSGRIVVVVANDATVKAGSWWPETIEKILRAQEIAMRRGLPIIYLVDSAGVNLPYQGGVFPGQRGAARIFYYNAMMRKRLRIPQLAAVMGPCIAGGAYLPALSDVIVMVKGTSFMGLGGPNLVRGATGEDVGREELGGSSLHARESGVAHYESDDDDACLELLREMTASLPKAGRGGGVAPAASWLPPSKPAVSLYDLLARERKRAYSMAALLETILDGGEVREFQEEWAKELICGQARIRGMEIGVLANRRGVVESRKGRPARFGGILYGESAEKAAYFIETMDRQGLPLLFVQDVAGFMVGLRAERSGIIRSGARFVEAMATARVPKLVLTVGHASGAGYYAMAGQGFDPDFIVSLPTGRMGVMEGESAVAALFGRRLEQLAARGETPDEELGARMEAVKAEYDAQLDALHAAARGFVDAVVLPEELRGALAFLLQSSLEDRTFRPDIPAPPFPAAALPA